MPTNQLTIGYTLDGQNFDFTVEVEAFGDLRHATRELQLHLIGQILAVQPWVIDRKNLHSYTVEATEPRGDTHVIVVEAFSREQALEQARSFDPQSVNFTIVP